VSDTSALEYRRQHPLALLVGMGHRLLGVTLIAGPMVLLNPAVRDVPEVLVPSVAGMLVLLVLLPAGLTWATQWFAIGHDALVVRSGVLFRRTRTIPYGRIQGINTAQSPMQRVLGLGSLRVDTGQQGVEAEAELPMLRWSDVLALQEELVRRRGPVVGGGGEAVPADGGASVVRPAPSGTVLATVSDRELLIAGATSAQLLVALGAIAGLVDRAGGWARMPVLGPLLRLLEARAGSGTAPDGGVIAAVFAAAIAGLAVLWVVGVVLTWARYRGFTLRHVGDTFVRTYGWLNRVSAVTPLQRIQALSWREPVLRRLVRYGELRAVSAGAMTVQVNGNQADVPTLVPILPLDRAAAAIAHVYPGLRVDLASATPRPDWQRPSRRTWPRTGVAWSVRAVLTLVPVSFLFGSVTWYALWGLPLVWACTPLASHVRGVARDADTLIVREGGLGRETWVIPMAKVQLVHLRQGPWQRAIGTASVRITTAGIGSIADVVDLPEASARALVQEISGWLATNAKRG